MSYNKIDPDDAPEGFKACLSPGVFDGDCDGCFADDGFNPCPGRDTGQLRCSRRNRLDGQNVIFVKKEKQMSDNKIDPNDAPEGFEACSSTGGRGKSCAGCHFEACIPCPERDDGTAWCSERNREDGQSVIFAKRDTTPVQPEPVPAKTPMHEWKERFHHAHDISCHYAHDTTSYFCISVCGTGYDISMRYNKDDMDVLIDQLKIVLREAGRYREISRGDMTPK